MRAKLQLIYDQSLSRVSPDQTQVLIEAKGYKQFLIPAKEITDELWQILPLTPNDFYIEIDDDEFFDYAEYQVAYRLQDFIGLGEIVEELADSLPQINSTTLSKSFLRFWNADQRIEYAYYLQEEALTTVDCIKQEFIADCLGVPEHEFFAFKTAHALGMELVFEPVEQRWINKNCFY